jgi:two-component system CheB/CheR fusion protein
LLTYYSPASVLTNLKGLLLYVHGDTGKYLRPAPGQASLNIQDMAREGLASELKTALHLAAAHEAPHSTQTLSFKTDKHDQPIQLTVKRVSGSTQSEPLLLISFIEPQTGHTTHQTLKKLTSVNEHTENLNSDASSARLQSLEFDLSYTRDNLRATIDEHQASNEELKSTNEELQSTNEELQSTNEELETSKEELQSVNEELVTVNTELQKKIEQLASMQNDMKNLLDNMNIGTIFLNKDMVIRRFTREATRAYRLIPSDVGRALEDIKCELNGKVDLIAQAQKVLKTLNPFEVELFAQNGNWYLAHIQPYRTLDNIIAGVVLTFTDITARVSAEAAVQTARTLAEGIVDTVLEPLVVLDATLKVVSASRSFYGYFHEEPQSTIGRLIYDLGNQQWNISALRELLETILPQQQSFEGYEMEHSFPNIGLQKMVLNARRIVDSGGNTQLILFAMRPLGTRQT